MRIRALALFALPLVLAACSKESAAPAGTSSSEAPKPSAASAASTANPAGTASAHTSGGTAATAAGTPTLVETDLSPAGATWKGWVANGPKDAKVMIDGVHDARIAANGMDAFDLTFGQGKASLKDMKNGANAGAKSSGGQLKVTFTVDAPDKLEWTNEIAGSKSFNFAWNYKASGKDVNCHTNTAMGVTSDAMLQVMKNACGTLTKK